MSEKSEKMTDKEIAQWQEELYELEPNCSTGKLGTPQKQKHKIDALLARARARKQRKLVGG
jgi:hypothetical protein